MAYSGIFNETLNDLRDEQLDAEKERLENLVSLHEDTQQRIEDLERESGQTIEDLRTEYQRDQEDAYQRLQDRLADADSDAEREEAIRDYNRRIQELTRQFHRDVADLRRAEAREREEIARRAAQKEIEIAEREAERLAEIERQKAEARDRSTADIASAETAAGVSFEEAQANYVPALSAHEQALLTHAEALNRINQEADQARSEAFQAGIDAAAAAAMTLSETLSAVTAAEQARLSALETETAETLSGLNQQITDAETQTGLSFEDALVNYTPAVDLNTQALQALTDALGQIDADEVSALSAVDAAGKQRTDAQRRRHNRH